LLSSINVEWKRRGKRREKGERKKKKGEESSEEIRTIRIGSIYRAPTYGLIQIPII
jgi:hypothetical protein